MKPELIISCLTLLVAIAGPFVAYHFAKRLFVSGNRQKWIDALRDDLAELIALADLSTMIYGRKNKSDDEVSHYRETMIKLQGLRFRIRLRLVANKPKHERLISAIEDFIGNQTLNNREDKRRELVVAAEALIEHVWANVERGR